MQIGDTLYHSKQKAFYKIIKKLSDNKFRLLEVGSTKIFWLTPDNKKDFTIVKGK